MGSIPLPALGIRPPDQPDFLGEVGKVMQLKSLMAQQQMQPIQLENAKTELLTRKLQEKQLERDQADQAKIADLYTKNNGDLDKTLSDAARAGVQPSTVMKYQDFNLDRKKKINEVVASGNTNAIAMNKLEAQASGAVLAAPEELKDQVYAEQRQNLLQAGISPDRVPPQRPPDAVLKIHQLGALDADKQIQAAFDAKKNPLELRQAAAAATEAEAKAGVAPQMAALGVQAKKADIAQSQASAAQSRASTVKTQLETQFLQNGPEGLQGVEPKLRKPAADAYAKASQEYATANEAAQTMNDFLQAAKSGNKTAVKIVPLQGALEITTAQGVHRINKTEVEQFGGGGSAYDKLAGKLGGIVTGKSISDDVLNSMQELQQTIQKNADMLHANKVESINKSYGSHFQPMKFQGQQTTKQTGPPAGATMKVPGSDGKLHWSDGKVDLGVAE